MGEYENSEPKGKVLEKSKPTVSLQDAVAKLIEELKADPFYRLSWQANIAMAFKDEMQRYGLIVNEQTHALANDAARRFLELLCH